MSNRMPLDVTEVVRTHLIPVDEDSVAAAVAARLGDAELVLIGEATHGTHEFYAWRAAITRRLIEHHGFTVVALEADWPDTARVHRWVTGVSADPDARTALDDFTRFPRWMWRNTVVDAFATWLRGWNEQRPRAERAGLFGLDLYSLHASIEAVLGYLQRVDPDAARRARDRYACFDHFGEDAQAYGYAAISGLSESCQAEVVAQLMDLLRRGTDPAVDASEDAAEAQFFAEQNARLVRNAEEYYRTMFGGRVDSWNKRDSHMMETLEALRSHLRRQGRPARTVVWAHNSHLGDARATQMGAGGELNLGQLVRERYDRQACLVGLTTYDGRVTAATDWGEPAQHRLVMPALAGSYEALFHEAGATSFLLDLRDEQVAEPLRVSRLQRAIGVVYRPQTERVSHYFRAHLPEQFDLLIHVDRTSALQPLDAWAGEDPEMPTFMT